MMGAVTTHATPEPDSVREDGALDRPEPDAAPSLSTKIGRASCRERV